MQGSPRLSVLFAAPECAPLAKTGGLGDVCAALPAALREQGVDARVLLPGYPEVLRGAPAQMIAQVSALGFEARLLEATLPSGVPLIVLDCPPLYVRGGGPYLAPSGEDWPDNALRFGFFSRVAAQLAGASSPLAWRPHVLHAHDWPAGLAPAYLRLAAGARAASVFTIHNLAFQGLFDASMRARLALPEESFAPEGLEFHGRLSFMKGGIVYADAITTVSPTYAREIQQPEQGCGLDGLLRDRRAALTGILNGIDTTAWNPLADRHLARNYDAASLERKAANKAALQRRLGLTPDPEVPLLGQVARLTHQKGADLVVEAGERLAALGQLAILGAGERRHEAALRALAARHAGRVAVHIGFDEPLAHLIEAGADLFLMPSRFEPCGLNQLYSQRYGTPPVARATGGLADTIEDGQTGFLFEPQSAEALVEAVRHALAVRAQPHAWRAVQLAGMARDASWSTAARRYADLYRRLASPVPA
ncbi:MAG TPA: glycogen synthase GlgA [Burkholderiales bacterium]|nr:glycogen synthase GlgA [Burkholderiales bacterium]